ncbi:hypothetical protein ACFE04_018001 [Oxalis oulophora]
MAISFDKFYILILFFTLLPTVISVSFNIPRFDRGANNILYEGDAQPSVGAIYFTSETYYCHIGRATYADRVKIWDSKTGKLSNFSTHFTFWIDTLGNNRYAAGIAFFLAPVGFQVPINSVGGFLGLFNTTTSDSVTNQIVAVEFDTFNNQEWDPADVAGHVGINNNSIYSTVYTAWNVSLHDGDNTDVWITYDANTMNFSVKWSYQTTNNPKENSSLSLKIDLRQVLPEWVTIGFSAATSQFTERHAVSFWEFSSSLESEQKSMNRANKITIIIVVVAVSTSIFVLAAALIIWKRKSMFANRTAEDTVNLTSINNDDLERGVGPRRYSYQELVSATRNFSGDRRLGQGGFGTAPLKWDVRYNIALGLASGLLYLHEEWQQCVVHRDIKSSNIMLDSNFSTKLGDFGLARLMDHELGLRTTGLAGTFGYLAPECLSASRASKESDVYSFGVVVLEIATGKNAGNFVEERAQNGLLGWVWDLYGSGQLHLAVDNKLNANFDKNKVECLMMVGLWCAHPDFTQRPSIRQAIQVLKFETALPNLPTKLPVPTYHVPTPSIISEATSGTSEVSGGTITNTSIVAGR